MTAAIKICIHEEMRLNQMQNKIKHKSLFTVNSEIISSGSG